MVKLGLMNTTSLKPDLVRRSHRKSLVLIVHADGKLEVRAPLKMSEERILQFVQSKESWVRQRQAAAVRAYLPAHTYQEGEEFLFLGNKCRLLYAKQQRDAVHLDGQILKVLASSQPQAAEVLEAWYRREARSYLAVRIAYFSRRHGFTSTSLRINSARTRWGSCNAQRGSLNFPWRLIMAPPEIVDYVVVHELCHLKQPNHSPDFWKEVETILPDYKIRRKWLKENSLKLRV